MRDRLPSSQSGRHFYWIHTWLDAYVVAGVLARVV